MNKYYKVRVDITKVLMKSVLMVSLFLYYILKNMIISFVCVLVHPVRYVRADTLMAQPFVCVLFESSTCTLNTRVPGEL